VGVSTAFLSGRRSAGLEDLLQELVLVEVEIEGKP
jgi:hypothetical protein